MGPNLNRPEPVWGRIQEPQETAMDPSTHAAVKTLLQQWIIDRQLTFQEQLTEAWRAAQERLTPDEDLVAKLGACLALAAPMAVPAAEPGPPAGIDPDAALEAGLDRLAAASTHAEVLKGLVEEAARCAGRSAVYVVKQGIATLYAHRGFPAIQDRPPTPVVPPPDLEDLIQDRTGTIDRPGPAYQALLAPLGVQEAPALRILPLRLRRRAVALLLADTGGPARIPCSGQLRALALAAEARLAFLTAVRDEGRVTQEVPPSMQTQRIPDPIAEPGPAGLDPQVRANAERSARVLVGDLELYFPAKVAQGRNQGNLYAAMKDELDRSRASFVERYGAELENQYRIFYKTIVQLLCAGDPTRLGPAPWALRPGS